MSNISRWQAGTAALLALGLTTGAVAPLVVSAPAFAQATQFSDVSSTYWARGFIAELSRRNIIAGYPDGTFKPDNPVTRAEFAAMLRKANADFKKPRTRPATNFSDVSSAYWAASAIQEAYTTGFMAGYPGNIFKPEQNIPREQVLVSLANGLNYSANRATPTVLSYYNDASEISNYARDSIAAATVNRLVVDYPNLHILNPIRKATRAEVAAFIYQALVKQGDARPINSPYIVGESLDEKPTAMEPLTIPTGTTIPVKYERAKKVLLTKDETAPLTVSVAADVTSSDGKLLIPAGSEISGELRPTQGGTRFVAQTLRIRGQEIPIRAASNVITTTETISKGINVGNLVRDAVLGSAAAAAISGVTGDRTITAEKVLIGTGAGTVAGLLQHFLGQNKVELLSVEPNTDLTLKLLSPLTVRAQ